jgi:hypothetical protein
VSPETTNSLSELVTEVILTDAVDAVSVPLRAELEPTLTLPKLNVDGVADNDPCAVPVPVSVMLSGELDAVETIETEPLAEPVAVGVKTTVNVTLPPAVSVVGNVSPLTE